MSLHVDIKKRLGNFRLDIAFDAENEILALLGASGCGKSMSLKCIAGIETPDEGIIVLNDRVLFDSSKKINLTPQQRKVGYLFQNSALFPNMTAMQNILCGMHKKAEEGIKHGKAAKMFEMFRLNGLENHYPSQLSGGQQQRVALARILVSDPDIIMLDEPFSALDSYLRWQLEQEISSILGEFNGTTLFISHNRDEVFRLCSRIAVIAHGKVDTIADKRELFNNPQTYAASLLTGCKNISEAKKLSDVTLLAKDWGVVLDVGRPIPDDIMFVGARARHFETAESEEEKNAFAYNTVRKLDDTFGEILIIRKADDENAKPIRWELDRKTYSHTISGSNLVKIKPENIMLLRWLPKPDATF